jgi:xanthine dehydrogenase molybdopterin-binding subunit B
MLLKTRPQDIPEEKNRFHTVVNHDEILFAVDEVFCVGQVVGVVVATNQVCACMVPSCAA